MPTNPFQIRNSEKNSVKFSEDFDIPVIANMQVARALDEFNIDFSIVTTPEWVRLVPLKLLVEKNVPILLEKPFCSSLPDALQLCKILEGATTEKVTSYRRARVAANAFPFE